LPAKIALWKFSVAVALLQRYLEDAIRAELDGQAKAGAHGIGVIVADDGADIRSEEGSPVYVVVLIFFSN